MIAAGFDLCEAKRQDKRARMEAAHTQFELVARLWLQKTSAARASSTQDNVAGWLERDVSPVIGHAAISALTLKDVLLCLQRMEARGVMESAHRVKQICGQIFRFAVASDLADGDVTADLKGAQALCVIVCAARGAQVRGVGPFRSRPRRVADPRHKDEDEGRSSRAAVTAGGDNPPRPKTTDWPWEVCPPEYPNRRSLHE